MRKSKEIKLLRKVIKSMDKVSSQAHIFTNILFHYLVYNAKFETIDNKALINTIVDVSQINERLLSPKQALEAMPFFHPPIAFHNSTSLLSSILRSSEELRTYLTSKLNEEPTISLTKHDLKLYLKDQVVPEEDKSEIYGIVQEFLYGEEK